MHTGELPTEAAYWVIPALLLAGEHPCIDGVAETQRIITTLVSLGIRRCIDVTEPHEGSPYTHLLNACARPALTCTYHHFPIPDRSVPSVEQMRGILNTIDGAHQSQEAVYVHCYAGIGRTGTVIGCYLARHGTPMRVILPTIARLRQQTAVHFMRAPETTQQRRFVHTWPIGR